MGVSGPALPHTDRNRALAQIYKRMGGAGVRGHKQILAHLLEKATFIFIIAYFANVMYSIDSVGLQSFRIIFIFVLKPHVC